MSSGDTFNPDDIQTGEELNEVLEQVERSAKNTAAAMSQMASATRGSGQAAEYQKRAMQALVKGQERQISLLNAAIQANRGNADAVAALRERLVEATSQLQEYNEAMEATETINTAAEKGLSNLRGMFGVTSDATENFVFQLMAMTSRLGEGNQRLFSMKNAMGALTTAANTFSSFFEQGFILLLKKGWDIAVGINDAQMQFAKTIAASSTELTQYNTLISQVTQANLRFGVSAQEVGEAFGSLYTTVTQFSRESERTQRIMSNTVSLLMQTGTSADTAAQSMQTMYKVMGMSGRQAEAATRELQAFAMALNVPPQIVQRDFAQMSMSLAVHGDKIMKVFKDLQGITKDTGLSMNQLLAITSQFDTFEGAANAAGRLNAVLGRDLFNSLEMLMTTDPYERFRKLRIGIEEAAGAFQDMEYYERKAIASAAGLQDVNELAMLMSGNLENAASAMYKNSMSAEELANQQMTLMSLGEKWNATLAAMAPQLEQLMNWLLKVVQKVADNIDKWKEWAPAIMAAYGAIKVFGAILPAMQAGLQIYTASAGAAATATGAFTAALMGGALGIGLIAALGYLGTQLFKPQHSPSIYDGVAAFAPRLRRAGSAASSAASDFRRLSQSVTPLGGAMASNLQALHQFQAVDVNNINHIADAIRNVARAVNEVDVTKSFEFRASISTLASQQVSEVVTAAVQLTRDDVQLVSDLVTQANKLAVASTVSNGDELSALVRAVAQVAQSTRSVAAAASAPQAGPENVEVTLKVANSTLARQVVPIVNTEMRRQQNQARQT